MHDGFTGLGLMPELVRAVDDAGWMLPSDVQDEAIPLILGGGDVMVAAETGSGKTGAFALPIIQIIHEIRRGELEAEEGGSGSGSGSGAGTGAGAGAGAGSGGSSGGARITEQVVLSNVDRDSILRVDDSGLRCECRQERAWGGARGTIGALRGKHYFEAHINDGGICRVGWSTIAGKMNLGTDRHGWGYGGTAKKANNGRFDDYGVKYGKGDVVGCMLDLEARTVTFSVNDRALPKAYDLPEGLQGALYPAVCVKNSTILLNFGATPFKHGPPAGYKGLQQAKVTQVMSSAEASVDKAKIKIGKPLAVVLEPAKDLAEQVYKSMEQLKKYVHSPEVTQVLVMGGMDTRKLAKTIRKGCDVVVGTPGMMAAFVKSGDLDLSSVRLFVLDEADQLCDEDNLPTIMKIYQALPKGLGLSGASRLQVAFFSATLHSDQITNLSTAICQNPTWVDLKGKDAVPDTVHHVVVPADPSDTKLQGILATIAGDVKPITDGVHVRDARQSAELSRSEAVKQMKPLLLVKVINDLKMEQALIFCRTNVDCNNLERFLTNLGGGRSFRGQMESGKENMYACCVLAGMRSMQERRANLRAFKEGHVRFLICTDVAARGIDITELPYVVNMTLPDVTENYIHRIGRVGRADKMGLAVSIVSAAKEKVWYHKCNKRRGIGCTNTKLLSQGGCTIWYDEPELLTLIEKRLDQPVERAALAKSSGRLLLPQSMRNVVYGEAVKRTMVTSEHVESIRSTVEELAHLEAVAQTSYFALQARFRGGVSASEPVDEDMGRATAAAGADAGSGSGSASHASSGGGSGGRRGGGGSGRGGKQGGARPQQAWS